MKRLLCILAISSTCFGYIRQVTGDASPVPLVRVDNAAIQFLLNSSVVAGFESSASGSSVTVISANSNPVAAVRSALATWSAVGTASVNFLPLQSTSLGINSSDFQMVIAVGSTPTELSAVGSALAVTIDSYATAPQVVNGVSFPKGGILDSDIIINPADSFSTDGSTVNDLQSVMTHELGHSLSANHTGLLGASMFQFNSNQRFLTTDDLAFVNSTYPLAGSGVSFAQISGTVTAGGAPVPYALLTAFDTSAGVTLGSITNTSGAYSFSVPPGNYQIYAEPLIGVVPINIYLTSAQLALAESVKFQSTLLSGSFPVAANGSVTANIAVTPGASSLAAPLVAESSVNAFVPTALVGGPVTIPSGQSVDLVFAGTGFDSTLSASNFAFYGQGITLQPGSVRVDKSETFNGFDLLRVTLNVPALTSQQLASFVVTSGSGTLSFSGALKIVPPTPTFVSAGVISAAAYTGIQGGVSPGGIYTIYDVPGNPNLGPGGCDPAQYVQNAPNYNAYGSLATTLAGVTVTFDGVPAPMFLSWGCQLNVQVPYEVAGKASTQVVVNFFGSASAPVPVPVIAVQPGFFTSDGKAVRAYNLPAYTINSAQNPAPPGSYVEVYGTGVGKLSGTLVTNQGSPTPAVAGTYTYSIGGSPAAPAYFAGLTSGELGLAQWDLLIPAGTAANAVPITVTDTVSGASSQPGATIFVGASAAAK
jgi:uncharacterized protein (TIGR03437 family)